MTRFTFSSFFIIAQLKLKSNGTKSDIKNKGCKRFSHHKFLMAKKNKFEKDESFLFIILQFKIENKIFICNHLNYKYGF